MRDKLYNFFNSPWVAFPLAILALVLFMLIGLKMEKMHDRNPHMILNAIVEVKL